MKKSIFYLLLFLVVSSCRPDLEYEIHGYTQKIIVEGIISNGEYPKVYLSLNVPLSETVDSVTVLENVIRTAKVTVSDGDKTEVLTSRWDKNHFPPYVYRGYSLLGEEGKTYYLTVEYGGYTVYSRTTIPFSTPVESFNTTPLSDNDALRVLSMSLYVDPSKKCGYRVFTRKNSESRFVVTPFVFNSEFKLSGINTFIVSPAPTSKDPTSSSEGGYFKVGDTVDVKLCTIDSISTCFFRKMTLLSQSGIGSYVFIGQKEPLESNISSPGFGVWYGCGTQNYRVIIK